MNFVKTSCCAITDIDHLSAHLTPKDAMVSFCQQALLDLPRFGKDVGVQDQIFSFYLFTAAVSPSHRPYGQDFYRFIIDNNLGEVWQSPLRRNKAWHPDRSNQVYVWMPDHDAIKTWWAANNPNKTAPEVTEPPNRKRKGTS